MNGRVDFPREHWMQFEKIKNLTNIGVEIQNERTELLQNIVFYSWQRERFFQWQMKQISSVSSVIETDMKVAEVQFIEGSIVILSKRNKCNRTNQICQDHSVAIHKQTCPRSLPDTLYYSIRSFVFSYFRPIGYRIYKSMIKKLLLF